MTEPQSFWKTLVLGAAVGMILAMNIANCGLERREEQLRACHSALTECRDGRPETPPSAFAQACDNICAHMHASHVWHEHDSQGYMCYCVSDTVSCRWYNYALPDCVDLHTGESP